MAFCLYKRLNMQVKAIRAMTKIHRIFLKKNSRMAIYFFVLIFTIMR